MRQSHAPTLALWWTLSRLVVLILLFGPESRAVGDVGYFAKSLGHVGRVGLGATMPEYPLPALLVVAVPWVLVSVVHVLWLYGFFFVGATLCVDALFTLALHRSGRDGAAGRLAAVSWLVAVPLMGGLTFVRFDVVPGVLAGLVILLLSTRPRWAAFLVALATSIKLWPVLLIPALVSGSRRRWAAAPQIAAVGLLTVVVTIALGGWNRLWSPLVYQGDRGLQIESVVATPVMARFAADPDGYKIFYSSFKAYEITGSGVSTMLGLSTVLTLCFAGIVLTVWVRCLRLGHSLSPDAFVWTSLCMTLGFMCVSKVLSPQYLLWLLPAACAGLAVVRTSYRKLLVWACGLGVAATLSHLIFPTLYTPLAIHGAQTGAAVSVLVVRNLILLVLWVGSARMAFMTTRAVDRGPVEASDEAEPLPGVETPAGTRR
jgi:hypothetical protein